MSEQAVNSAGTACTDSPMSWSPTATSTGTSMAAISGAALPGIIELKPASASRFVRASTSASCTGSSIGMATRNSELPRGIIGNGSG